VAFIGYDINYFQVRVEVSNGFRQIVALEKISFCTPLDIQHRVVSAGKQYVSDVVMILTGVAIWYR
jgi:hypothetical protein